MLKQLVQNLALWSVSKGVRLPQKPVERFGEAMFLRSLLQQLEIDCVLDVGANRGQFAGELRRIGYAGMIVSFEPVKAVFQQLQAARGHDPRWRGHPFALGSRAESKDINVPTATVFSSLLEPIDSAFERFSVSTAENRTETIDIRRLDEMLPEIESEFGVSRIFLKMDTQGFDLEVFRGASGCLDRIRGMQSELSIQPLYKGMPHYLESLAEYERAGFELFNLSVVNRTRRGGLLEMNCYMRRPEEAPAGG